jgi:hypothetical protein
MYLKVLLSMLRMAAFWTGLFSLAAWLPEPWGVVVVCMVQPVVFWAVRPQILAIAGVAAPPRRRCIRWVEAITPLAPLVTWRTYDR